MLLLTAPNLPKLVPCRASFARWQHIVLYTLVALLHSNWQHKRGGLAWHGGSEFFWLAGPWSDAHTQLAGLFVCLFGCFATTTSTSTSYFMFVSLCGPHHSKLLHIQSINCCVVAHLHMPVFSLNALGLGLGACVHVSMQHTPAAGVNTRHHLPRSCVVEFNQALHRGPC